MADLLHWTPENLIDAVIQFQSCQTSLQTAYLTMSDAVRSLDTTDASKQFLAQFDSMYKDLSQPKQKMADVIDELLKAHDIYLEMEIDVRRNHIWELDEGTSPFA